MNATCFTFPLSPPGQAAWVADPSCRGTFNITLLCLSTTIICIWSSVHRDIPLQRLSLFRSLLRDAPLVLVALFAPELLFYFALNQFLVARNFVKIAEKSLSFQVSSNGHEGEEDYRHLQSASKENLTLDNIEMRKLLSQDRIYDDSTSSSSPQNIQFSTMQGPPKKFRHYPFTLKHGFYATMGGFAFKKSVSEDGGWCFRPQKLTIKGVKFVMQHAPDLIPDIPITSITDRSKSNSLGKTLLAVQVAWFCLNCASRLAEHLPLSLLEVSTLAHGLFTLSSYAMWWSKPLSVEEPTWISLCDNHTQELLALLQLLSSDDSEERKTFLKGCSHFHRYHHRIDPASRIVMASHALTHYSLSEIRYGRNRYLTDDSVPKFSELFFAIGLREISCNFSGLLFDYVVTTCIPLIYGLLHFLALRAQFPTIIERELWRTASVVVMTSGATAALVVDTIVDFVRRSRTSKTLKVNAERYRDICYSYIIPPFYLLGSGYLLVQSIRQLWYLPHDTYVVASWSYYIPHLL